MASPNQGSVDLAVEVFGGRVTQFDPQKLPQGASPFNQDVCFSGTSPSGTGLVSGVAPRPGLASLYPPLADNPTVNYIRTFVDSQDQYRQLFLDGLGDILQSFPETIITTIGNAVPGSFCQSTTYAGREWMAFGDGQFGLDIPRHWNGINLDRVSQVGPGASPNVFDFVRSITIDAAATGLTQPYTALAITSMSQVGNIVTVVMAAGLDSWIQVGDQFKIASAGVAAYDGTWNISNIPSFSGSTFTTFQFVHTLQGLGVSAGGNIGLPYVLVVASHANAADIPPPQTFTIASATNAAYDGSYVSRHNIFTTVPFNKGQTFAYPAPLTTPIYATAASGGGTATVTGNIAAGLHQVAVSFVTRSNYITAPSIPASWTSSGNLLASLTDIPIGPPNVIARIVMFTPVIVPPASSGPFFYFNAAVNGGSLNFMSMVIQDNSTTSMTFDFTDAVLQNATSATLLFNLLELGECSGVVSYSERTFWLGERNKVNAAGGGGGFNNLTFDGGFSNPGLTPSYPLGWNPDAVSAPGGGSAVAQGLPAYWGDAYAITGDGATPVRGLITQGASDDYLGIPLFNINTSYSARFRLAVAGTVPLSGTFIMDVASINGGPVLGSIPIPASILTAEYQEFTGLLFLPQASFGANQVIRVYAQDTLTNGSTILVDCIEFYPTLLPVNLAQVRCSFAEQPEAFDSETGIMIVGKDNGQAMRSMKTLLDNKLYLNKERSLYVTNDDGQNEPDLWTISTVSDTVGTPSVNGTAVGESWMVIASHEGLYIFDGSQPKKISHEIQPDWNGINWNAGPRIYTVVDTTNKRIHVGVPTGNSLVCNAEYVLDFAQLADAETIASTPQAYYSIYNPTKVIAPGRSRKWTIWNLFGGQGANSAAITVRADGSYHLLRGNAAATGKIYDQVVGQFSDDGIAIAAIYQTFFMPESEQEIALQLGAYRKLFKYMSAYAWGSGQLAFTITGPQGQRQIPLSTLTLTNPAQWDWNFNVNWVGERASIIFSQFGVGSWFELTKLCPTVQKEILTSVRGNN